MELLTPHSMSDCHVLPRRSAVLSLAVFIQAVLLLPHIASAATPDIVGTWRKSDQSLVEFKADGSVTSGTSLIGKWERLRDSPKYVLRFNGASTRNFYYVTTGRYKRQLSIELPSNGSRTHLDRIDDGATINPDVPDAHAALELEYNDTVASIARTVDALGKAQAAAAEAWQKHHYARSIGRISGWIPIAQRAEAEARSLESSLNSQQESLKKLAAKLGKAIPPQAAPPAPVQPPVFQPPTGGRGMPPFGPQRPFNM